MPERRRRFWSRPLRWKGRALSGALIGFITWLILALDEPFPLSATVLVTLAMAGALAGLLIDRNWGG
jgi:hypothetical protein